MRHAFVALAFVCAAAPAWAQRETVIVTPGGEKVTVRTDESGTTVIRNDPGQNAKLPLRPGMDAHREKVDEFTREGGKIELERSEQK